MASVVEALDQRIKVLERLPHLAVQEKEARQLNTAINAICIVVQTVAVLLWLSVKFGG